MKDRNESSSHGISRRDVLKTFGAGTLLTMLPGCTESIKTYEEAAFGSKPHGIIFMIGDGMPLGVIRAMHEISTQEFGRPDSNLYALMRDPATVSCYMGTKSLSSMVTDSAPASAAWSTGSHTANGMLAALPDGTPLMTIMELVKDRGFATGLVTTTRVTHATPAAWVSHNKNRNAEFDIALDYLNFLPDILLGGGSKYFDPLMRPDRRDIFAEFAAAGYYVCKDKAGLTGYDPSSSKDRRILGIFNPSHLSYYVDRVNDPAKGNMEPTLAEMTAAALSNLSRNPDGFVLQVEAGRIDHANHANDAWSAIMDAVEMDLALGVILKYVKLNPNVLLIITSDHGNSGWGINGTGPGYNDSAMALRKYNAINASFEVITPKFRGKQANEIKDIVKSHTSFDITDAEAQMIHNSLQPGYHPYPGDFSYPAETVLGKILAHSKYGTAGAKIRRGNIAFTSNSHTGEDQIALIHGPKARDLGLPAFVYNTDLFKVMCRFLNVRHSNPSMSAKDATHYVKIASQAEWERDMVLHVS
ncbi:MAG TPA: alkaline phosphatase [Dissulfurispiraceae bacterium]|nr:alkaline phosphatase [Dissulfurispiraceae bacterium]